MQGCILGTFAIKIEIRSSQKRLRYYCLSRFSSKSTQGLRVRSLNKGSAPLLSPLLGFPFFVVAVVGRHDCHLHRGAVVLLVVVLWRRKQALPSVARKTRVRPRPTQRC